MSDLIERLRSEAATHDARESLNAEVDPCAELLNEDADTIARQAIAMNAQVPDKAVYQWKLQSGLWQDCERETHDRLSLREECTTRALYVRPLPASPSPTSEDSHDH